MGRCFKNLRPPWRHLPSARWLISAWQQNAPLADEKLITIQLIKVFCTHLQIWPHKNLMYDATPINCQVKHNTEDERVIVRKKSLFKAHHDVNIVLFKLLRIVSKYCHFIIDQCSFQRKSYCNSKHRSFADTSSPFDISLFWSTPDTGYYPCKSLKMRVNGIPFRIYLRETVLSHWDTLPLPTATLMNDRWCWYERADKPAKEKRTRQTQRLSVVEQCVISHAVIQT